MSYLGCFWFSFYQGCMVNKRRHYSAGGIPLHMFHVHYSIWDGVLHILDNSNICVSFLSVMDEFGHTSITYLPLLISSRVLRALDNTETVLFGVCFAFLMCIVLHGRAHSGRCTSRITDKYTFVIGSLCSEMQITPKPCFSPYFSLPCWMRKRPRSVTWLHL